MSTEDQGSWQELYGKYVFDFRKFYQDVKSNDWPPCNSIHEFDLLPGHIREECIELHGLFRHIKAADKTSVFDHYIVVPHLEWHAAHACNLTCQSCSHLSNHKHSEIISVSQLQDWFRPWINRIIPRSMAIVGGEPLLNQQIEDIIKVSREMWPKVQGQKFELVTNGLLLDRFPSLPKTLVETGCTLSISIHDSSIKYKTKMEPIIKIVNAWRSQFGIEVNTVNLESGRTEPWFKVFNGYGDHMIPYTDNDPQSSWDHCAMGQNCFQLVDSKIYKCAPLAYLPLQAQKYQLSNKWKPYLSYQALAPDCTSQDIRWFFNRGAEPVCSMCPSQPQHFTKRDPMIPVKFYETSTQQSALPTP